MRKHKQGRKKCRGAAILIASLVLVLVYILFFSPLFKIKSVEILESGAINEQEIKNNFNYANIFLSTTNKIKNNLIEKIPRISEIEIKKNLIKRTIKLTIKERKKIGIICQVLEEKESCFYVDEKGIIFEKALQTSGSLILLIKDFSQRDFIIGGQIIEQNKIEKIVKIKEYLSNEINIVALEFDILSIPLSEIKVLTSENWYILFSIDKEIKNQLLGLKAALKEKISAEQRANLEYVDLRIENRIYYK